MNRLLFFLFAILSLAVMPDFVYADEVEQYTMPKKDGKQGDKMVDGTLLFYDMGGPNGATISNWCGYTRFVPAHDGQQIRITFDSFELTGTAPKVYVYDGDIDFTAYSSPVPDGYMAELTGTLSGESFESSTGSLSVLYYCHSYSNTGGFGWEATVEEFTPADMSWLSATATTPEAVSAYRGQKNAAILGVNLLTEGSNLPFTCSSLSFNLEGSTLYTNINNLRILYSKGSNSPEGVQFGDVQTAADGTITFTGNQQLRGGNNYFWLVADIPADATAGAKLDATLTGATVADVQRVSEAITPAGDITIVNEVRLSTEPTTYTVSEPLTLYDDGGVDGTISLNFDGMATFKPATEGKVIRVTFTDLHLFNTSTIDKNDKLNIYAGSEKANDTLLATLLKDPMPAVITSSAADGSMTISLTSTTGTNPQSGFVATIEEVEPQNMAVSLVEATQPNTETVSGGDVNARTMLIRVNTAGTLNPYKVNSMSFTNGSTAGVTRAALLYLGKDSSVTGSLAGETVNPGEAFIITLNEPQALTERDNYFMLVFDVAPTAVNDQIIDATLTKVNDLVVEDGNPEGNRVVSNVVFSDNATVSKTIYGTWTFKNKPSTYSSYAYDSTSGNQVTTFMPGTEGMIVQLDFTKFKLYKGYYYAPIFKVYDGTDTTAPLLWEATENTYTTGPGRVLRPSNADGALTVLFYTQSSATSGYGFEAQVSEYLSQPMVFESVSVAQVGNGSAATPGATDLPVLSIANTTSGDKDPLSLTEITFDLKENWQLIKKAKLYSTGISDEFATTTLVAEADVETQTVTFAPASFTLSECTSYLWLAVDMADTFPSDRKIDAALTAEKIAGNNVTIANGDPEGELITKNIYLFGGNDATVTVQGSMLFYDDGGPAGKYTTSHSGKVTFMPACEGEVIRMTVNNFYTNYQDYLYFYEGASPASDAKAVQSLSSSQSADKLNPIISHAEDGAITVSFDPKKNNVNDGWEILVESFVPQPMFVAGIDVTLVNDGKMLRGSADNKLLKLTVNVKGEKEYVTIDNFKVSALESDSEAVTAAKLYYTGVNDAFDLSNLYGTGTLTDGTYLIEGSQTFDEAGTYFFWLTYDINTEAELEAKVQAQLLSLAAGDNVIAPVDEKKVLLTIQEGMHGTYSVGTSGEQDFISIKAAVTAMAEGIDGPVVFELEDGNYNELVTVPEIIGSSDVNTITFCSKSGNRDNVTISYNTYTNPGSSNYDKRYGVFTFDGVDYCTLRDVTVTSTASDFPGLVFFRNKSEHVTIDNCVFKLAKSTNSASGSYLVYQYVKSGDINTNHNYTTIQNCLLDGGYIGVGLTGTSTVAHPKQHGGRIINNVFRNQGSKGIYVANEEDAYISGNDIMFEGETTSTPYGMDLSEFGGDITVCNNVIRTKACTGSYTPNPIGIYLRIYNMDNVKDGVRRIYNNEINITDAPGASACGIRFNNGIPNVDVINNTIRMAAANTEGERVTGIYIAGDIDGTRIMNNILQMETPGNVIYSQRLVYTQKAVISHNVGYSAGDNFGYIGGTSTSGPELPEGYTEGSKSFEEICTWAPMTDSYNESTEFLSTEFLEPANTGHLVGGMPVDYITTDLYGAERAAIPTIGAYEYAESTVAPSMADGYPVVKNIAHDQADYSVMSALTGTMAYAVYDTEHETPSAEDVKNEDLIVELRKGVETTMTLKGLTPNTTYRVYAVLTSLRDIDSEVIATDEFTTSYEPTRVATFEEAVIEETRVLDGTMSFTGFSIEDITDGVAPAPNAKAAVMDDEYAVIQLTNAANLGLEGLFMRNNDVVTLTTMDDELTELESADIEASETWRYIDLKNMGKFTYITLECEGDVYIDNVGALPLQMLIDIDRNESQAVNANEEYSLTVAIDGGVAPYSYDWMDAAHNVVATSATYTYTPTVSNTYTVKVTDARGAEATAKTAVRVLGDMAIATFDDLYLPEDSHWCGDVDDEDYMTGSFFSGSFEFNNLYMADWDSWAFFGYSNHTSTSFSTYVTDQWNSAVGHGVDNSDNYGVVFISPYMGSTVITLSNSKEGQVIPGMYITNNAWVVDAILNGDGMSEGAFGEGDNIMLQLKGTAADGSTSELEIPLADYSADNEKDRWYLDTWQWVDLSGLGKVMAVEWNMTSTKSNSSGMSTPAYVCIDNLGATRPVAQGQAVTLAVNDEESPVDSFELAPFFSFDVEDGTVTYEIETDDERLSLEGSTVSCSAKADEQLSLIAHATQRGRHEWVNIPVSMTNKPLGIADVELDGVVLYPNPADSYVKVNAAAAEYDVTVFAMDGRTMMSVEALSGTNTLDTANMPAGTYIVKLSDTTGHTAVRKLIVKH
ncbi:MAG: DUF4465 domain-containing protein [Muribaculaceae bacterium]|nr:DUF4465 domain-containing protein [Muribaculaceae bacterium]